MRSHSTSRWSPTALGSWLVPAAIIALAVLLTVARPAGAQEVDTGASSAFDLAVSASIAGIGAGLGPFNDVGDSGPPDYAVGTTVLAAGVSGPIDLNSETAFANASGTFPDPANGTVEADAGVEDLDLSIGTVTELLSLTADVIQSEASVEGPCGEPLTATGDAILTGVALDLNLPGVDPVTIPIDPDPNTVVLDLDVDVVAAVGSVFIIANEQIESGDGNESLSILVNALRISISLSVPVAGTEILTADITIAHSEASLDCDLDAESGADLQVTKSASPDPVTVGEALTYTIEATNEGPEAATDVEVVDELPATADFVSVTPEADCDYDAVEHTVTCTFDEIAVDATETISIVVTPTEPGTIVNTATATAEQDDPCPECAEDTTETTVTEDPGPPPPPPGPDPIFPTPTPPADVEDDDEAVTPPAPPVAAPVAPAPAPPVAAPPADADADTDAAPAPADTGHGPWTDGPGGPSALVAGMAGGVLALLAAAGAALALRKRMLTP